ncbi:MAG: hypothetical protein Q4B88_00790 [Moraxella sp.]|nr:hypothetical protein [Moraxella sp.]
MRIDRLTARVRPLSPDQALDLGMAMARAWYVPLVTLWFLSAWAFLLLFFLVGLFEQRDGMISENWVFFMWFVLFLTRPYYELSLLWFLSQKLFNDAHVPKKITLKSLGVPYGAWWRFSLRHRLGGRRILAAAVYVLENQRQKRAINARLSLLARGQANAGLRHWLTFMAVEWLLFFGLFVLMVEFSPFNVGQADVPWQSYFETGYLPWWLFLLIVGLYVGVVGAMTPFFVASAFALYVCRRSLLEGWEIELLFRQMASRYQDAQITHKAGRS